MSFPKSLQPSQIMWRRPPFAKLRAGSRPSLRGEARRYSATTVAAIAICASLLAAALPASAATWTIQARPARLVNGAPVLFQVKPPAKLDSLSGTWLGHQLTFSYDASTKTWFTLAGVSIETKIGRAHV